MVPGSQLRWQTHHHPARWSLLAKLPSLPITAQNDVIPEHAILSCLLDRDVGKGLGVSHREPAAVDTIYEHGEHGVRRAGFVMSVGYGHGVTPNSCWRVLSARPNAIATPIFLL